MDMHSVGQNVWVPWSDKSENIPFKSVTVGVGDGEDKVASELGTIRLGQNSPYDMEPLLNGVATKCDVKKLDTQNDFNTGKEGSDSVRPIKMLYTTLLHSMVELSKSEAFSYEEQENLHWFHDVSPDELAAGTLERVKKACAMLCIKKKMLRDTLPTVPFVYNSQTIAIPLDSYYRISKELAVELPVEMTCFMETLLILQKMDHIYVDEPGQITKDLDSLVVRIFTDVKPIIVHEEKGYMIINNINSIRFLRITRGNPRFKVLF